MNTKALLYKLKYICAPLVGLSAALAVAYSALNWLLVAGSGLIPVDDQVVDYWLPIAAAILLLHIFVWRRVRCLKLGAGRLQSFYWFLAVAILAGPTIVAQRYVEVASGTLTTVPSASDIWSAPTSKYYSAQSICIAKDAAAVKPVGEVVGRHNETLVLKFYVAVPICANRPTDRSVWPLWVGLTYRESISNRMSDAQKDGEFKRFADQSQQAFATLNPKSWRYLERLRQSTDLRNLEKALESAGDRADAPIILVPHTDSFAQRTGNRLAWAFATFVTGALAWLFLVLILPLDSKRVRVLLKPAREPAMPIAGMFLIPSRGNYGLPILLDLNIAVFACMVFAGLGLVSFQADDLLSWGANYGPALHGFGVLRLITSQFVHGGLMHVANNLYGLAFAGMFLLPIVHNARLIFCYVACGIIAELTSVTFHPHIVAIGASGSIMGMFGILLLFVVLGDKRISEARSVILTNVAIFAGLTLVLGLVTPGVDNAAHIGGLIAGLAIGLGLFLYDRRHTHPVRNADRPKDGHPLMVEQE